MGKVLGVALCAVLFAAGGAQAQPGPAGPQFILTGVVVVEGGGRAWLQEPQLTGNQVVPVRPNESIGPYRVTKILHDHVELMGPNGAFSVMLAGVQGPVTASAPPPPPTVPAPVSMSQHLEGRSPDPPLAPAAPGTQRVEFESLLRGLIPR